jgi:hypothetical protein
MPELLLPGFDSDNAGRLVPHTIGRSCTYKHPLAPLQSRIAYSAAHVVADPIAEQNPQTGSAIDWESTMAYRRYLWDWGLGVAEAMDTAQRGMGLSWPAAQELIARAMAEAKTNGGLIACGAGTDHLPEGEDVTLEQIAEAYEEQCGFVEKHGGRVILMASRALARAAKSPDDYEEIYSRILRQLQQPAILHWLGDMFDPKLAGYWGSSDVDKAMESCLGVIIDNASQINGIKISLLDKKREEDMRRMLPAGVRMYTGDDFNYDELIAGDGSHHSDALLGIFDGIAPAASAAIQALDAGNRPEFDAILAPTLALSRHIFQSPTYLYKTGIVFLAWLNGQQKHFHMLGAVQSARSISHLAKLLVLAEDAGVLLDPDLACHRMGLLLELAGIQ